ncbi:hypothetical protein TPHA_0A05080 [Tetrapisispora phaffii CBS 4417]|uniref:Uncharacterized protein n=1 Tax=Tetrapisispora phaffii (strain ATCC 24235 / CBS 4417 / NBRC 1672 / NRRL Y-8282 / UCD 70-5) TaxID=1071381 RepID=G8BNV5_TETPH|nr:hypothetical protein TPHA_0A05080 [Tetrapisispora phaffii CBS 4417]CCE61583.1 hypothetical protein TPHA_0A05080 [Tetrapisispora phaffii CBS 4417]
MNNQLEKKVLLDKTNTKLSVQNTNVVKDYKANDILKPYRKTNSDNGLLRSVPCDRAIRVNNSDSNRIKKPIGPVHKQLVNKIKEQFSRNKFFSPTDAILSPCSEKINNHREKTYKVKSTPERLNFKKIDDEEDIDIS